MVWLQMTVFKTLLFLTAFTIKKSQVPQLSIAMMPKIMPVDMSIVNDCQGWFINVFQPSERLSNSLVKGWRLGAFHFVQAHNCVV